MTSVRGVRTVRLVKKSTLSYYDEMMNNFELDLITSVLIECEDNKSKAAKKLGIPRPTLYYKLAQLNLMPVSRSLKKHIIKKQTQ